PVSMTGPPAYASTSTSAIPIDPRLLPAPYNDDRDLIDPSTIAKTLGLVPAKKVAGSRRPPKKVDKGKKRARDNSGSEDSGDDAPAAKRGRPKGAPNYSKEDVRALFGFVQTVLPIGSKGWKEVHLSYNKYRREKQRPKRDAKSLENKFKQYLKLKKPTGEGECPPEVKRAHELEALLNERAGTRDLSDSEMDNSASAAESSDDVQVVDNPSTTVHTAVAKRAPTPPLHRSRKSAPRAELIDKLSRAFDPEVQKARDEDRSLHSAQNTQIFTLSQQLRDAHASSESLRNQISILQQQLHDAERARDVALLRLEYHDGPRRGRNTRRGDHSRSRSPRRSPRKVRCEARYPGGGACTYWVSDTSDSEN
ncbi:hypothetical protein DFH09DRAFT_866320, partial [Mycena vulgaris]